MGCPDSLRAWIQEFVPAYPVSESVAESLYEKVQTARFDIEAKTVRDPVPVEQVHRLVESFNKVNLINKKKVNCKTIVDPFAGGSGVLAQVQSFLKTSLEPCDFKEFEFLAVDHPNVKKSIKLDARLDIFDAQENGRVPVANYICEPPCTGAELVAFMFFAERCRDFCAFLLPATWINPRDELQRAWWGKKCLDQKAYRLKVSAGKLWMVVLNSKHKGDNIFAKAKGVQRAGSEKEVHVYARHMAQERANENASENA
ncbi:hypothetical protein CYMTET_5987 [Cymbomonas tetramitiformis]|uniref:Uncharacterized protein n=1 Tax=Cymbomonas tetramitiformis TaxID=36881 RepID=A0AAE0LIV8_9CHLO|nr:hypothetical protein CYMTET_19285 [Cymbomonas tetramitiformis]KAK3286460.1 hypothetical protein CYMTET_5987 [Cymbomonas tetramitiformis]